MKLTLRTATMVLVFLALPLASEAQQAGKVWRIGYLSQAAAEGDKSRVAAFRQGLRELGYVEGENVVVEQRYAPDQPERLLELLKHAVPSASRVAALFNPAVPQAVRQLKRIQAAAPALGLTVLPFEVSRPGDIDAALARIANERAEALFIIPDPTWSLGHRRIADLAVRYRLPAIGTVRGYADEGLLMSYGTNFDQLWRRAATYVDKILKGAKPGDLPIEHPTKFELVINLKTATALGLTIPPSVLLRADHVIQ
jgi:putative ABC transport system substrate-binding protein